MFIVISEPNAGLIKLLPDLCQEIRGLIGERRVTIVFDRGGWSPKLFHKLIAQGFDSDGTATLSVAGRDYPVVRFRGTGPGGVR